MTQVSSKLMTQVKISDLSLVNSQVNLTLRMSRTVTTPFCGSLPIPPPADDLDEAAADAADDWDVGDAGTDGR